MRSLCSTMAAGLLQGRVLPVQNFFTNADKVSASIPIAVRDGIDTISLLVTAKDGKLPQHHPKQLKEELKVHLTSPTLVESIHLSRQGRLTLTTRSIVTAQEILRLEQLLGVSVSAYVQIDTITTRFILHLDQAITCEEIALELAEQNIVVYEVRRFEKRVGDGFQATPTVLVTCYGTTIPTEVKLWYQRHRIYVFSDKPRQCGKCYRFNHATSKCRSDSICMHCATAHTGQCSSPTLFCINCKRNHPANDKRCPSYLREVQIQKYKSQNHLTIQEARRQFRAQTKPVEAQYATVAARPPAEMVTKSEFESTVSQLFTKITNTLEMVLNEMQSSIHSLLGSLTMPLVVLVQEVQGSKASKQSLVELQSAMVNPPKKFKLSKKYLSSMDFSSETLSTLDHTEAMEESSQSTSHMPNG